jgi:hypothetical protein
MNSGPCYISGALASIGWSKKAARRVAKERNPDLLVSASFWCQNASGTSLSLTIGFKGELLGPFSGTSIVLVSEMLTPEAS